MLPSYKYKYLCHLYDYAKNLFLIKQFGADKFLVTFTSWVNACTLLEPLDTSRINWCKLWNLENLLDKGFLIKSKENQKTTGIN